MPKVIRAVYDRGVFRPTEESAEESEFLEGQEVQLIVWDAEPFQWATFKTNSATATFTWDLEEGRWRLTWSLLEQVKVSEGVERLVREWQSVYEGLSEEDIAEVERIALGSRQRPSPQEGESS
mgnify:CR=1 FL=1